MERRELFKRVLMQDAGSPKQVIWITSAKWVASFLSSFWLHTDIDIKILCILSVVDVILGIFNHNILFMKLIKRLAITFLLVGTVHYVYILAIGQGLNVGFDIAGMVTGFYCIGESIMILKGVSQMGVQLPPTLLDLIGKAEGLTGMDRHEITALKLKQDEETMALEVKIEQRKDGESQNTVISPDRKDI